MNYDVLFGDYEVDENENMVATGPMIAFRALFIIDKKWNSSTSIGKPPSLGRNVDEAIRMVDAFIIIKNTEKFVLQIGKKEMKR